MSTEHTPGPWRVAFSDGTGENYITADNDKVVVSGAECGAWRPTGVRFPADGRLIAAAPDLLAACEAFAKYDAMDADLHLKLDVVAAYQEAADLVHAAIAKATEGAKP
jgi:hypothetical protein